MTRGNKPFTTKIRDFAGETPLQAMAKQGGYQPTAMTPQERHSLSNNGNASASRFCKENSGDNRHGADNKPLL